MISPYDDDEIAFYSIVNAIVQFRELYGIRELARAIIEAGGVDADVLKDEIERMEK